MYWIQIFGKCFVGGSKKVIKDQVQQSKKCVHMLNSLLYSNKIKLNTKIKWFRVIVEPVIIYGLECWQMSKKVGEW